MEAVGHGHDIVVNLRLLRGLLHLVRGGIGPAVADVLKHRIRKEEHILLDDTDILMQAPLGHVPDIQPINGNRAAGHVVEPGDQLT